MDEIVAKVHKLLESNSNKWEDRYEGYISKIEKKQNELHKPRKPKCLYFYSSVSRRNGRSFDLRFDGQSVAEVTCCKSGVNIYPREKANIDYFGLKMLVEMDWNSDEATQFRKFFRDKAKQSQDIRIKSPEHRVENRLLKEFSKKTRAEHKALCNIQPVRLYGCYFQMPTPVKASGHDSQYTDASGGIDILARVVSVSGEHRICVMEVKDENKELESQRAAMKQAVSYAVFIAKLLRSKSGQKWWDFFMNRGTSKTKAIPMHLNIDVVTIMPEGNTEEFCDKKVEVEPCSATLHCHSLYYDDDEFKKRIFKFSGTYIRQLKK